VISWRRFSAATSSAASVGMLVLGLAQAAHSNTLAIRTNPRRRRTGLPPGAARLRQPYNLIKPKL
jgi:hypothetical protein